MTGLPFSTLDFPGGASLGIYLAIVLAISLLIARAGIHLSLANLVGAGSNWWLAGLFAVAWWSPERLGGEEAVKYCVALMILEFFLMHSSAFFTQTIMQKSDLRSKLRTMGGPGLLYSLFAASLSFMMRSVWPFLLFWWITLSRFAPPLLRRLTVADQQAYGGRVAVSAIVYLCGVFLTLFYPVPELGIRGGLSGMGDGLWVDDPERCVAFGLTYFYLLGLFELTIKPDPATTAA